MNEMIMNYILPFVALTFFGIRYIRARQIRTEIPEWLKNGAIVVDVRSASEFAISHVPGSKNIPVDDISKYLHELDPQTPIIVCCASGLRSGLAAKLLQSKGFSKVLNAGSWTNIG